MNHTKHDEHIVTGQGQPSAGEGIGQKIRGAAEAIHGMGENIRGTTLGAVDTAVHGRPNNTTDNVAARGREEMTEGSERMKTGTAPSPSTHTEGRGAHSNIFNTSRAVGRVPARHTEAPPPAPSRRVPPPPHPRNTEGY